MTHHSAGHRDPAMDECIRNCTECHAACIETISYCLAQAGKHADEHHLALLAACADICRTSADTMLRGADVHVFTCGACAEICRRCAEACAAVGDGEMDRCAETCRRCAESCARMARAA